MQSWTGTASLKALLETLPDRRKSQLAGLTLLTVINGAADLLLVATGMLFLTALAGKPVSSLPISLPEGPAAAALMFAASTIAANLVRLLYLYCTEHFLAGVNHELTVEVQRRVLAQPYDYHVRHHSSALIASMQKVEELAYNLVQQWLQTAAAVSTGLAVFVLLVRLDPGPALLAFAALGLFYILIARAATQRLASNAAVLGTAYEERIAKVQEALGAIRDLKIDHSERAQLEDFGVADIKFWRARASTGAIVGAPRFIVEAGAVLLVAMLVVLLTGRGGGNALALIGGIAIGGMRLLPLLQTAYRSWANSKANGSLATDVIGMLRLPLPDDERSKVDALPFHQSVTLANVSFRYAERAEPAVKSVSLCLERGSRTALAGRTGSGKSTLADVLMGLLRPSEGSIAVDGRTLDGSAIRGWQKNVAHVAQAIFLADTTIARNIAFSRPDEPIDMDRVRWAAAQAEIREFIESLPDGFETRVGERGVRLSGGQRQRIGIARALYKDCPFLVLDEATNALDEEVEAKVLHNIFANKDRTILMIAHRPTAIAKCERTVAIQRGKLSN